jgi:hypothetical protein
MPVRFQLSSTATNTICVRVKCENGGGSQDYDLVAGTPLQVKVQGYTEKSRYGVATIDAAASRAEMEKGNKKRKHSSLEVEHDVTQISFSTDDLPATPAEKAGGASASAAHGSWAGRDSAARESGSEAGATSS